MTAGVLLAGIVPVLASDAAADCVYAEVCITRDSDPPWYPAGKGCRLSTGWPTLVSASPSDHEEWVPPGHYDGVCSYVAVVTPI